MQPIHHLVPDFIYEKYRAGESHGTFPGAAMFADLSGFSIMTDTLSAHGTHGAEVLADVMRVVFEPLVNAIYAQGGFVIGYAGDAFNAVFPAGQDSGQAMTRCLSAAMLIQMRTEMRPKVSTPYGDFPIRIKVGIGFGDTRWQIFKSTNEKRASYWFRGDSLNGAVIAEESAQGGEIVADSIAYELLKDRVQAVPANDCFLIQAMDAELPPPLPVSKPKPADDLIGIFLAEPNVRLPAIGEFRQVLNLFIDIPPSISDEALIAPFMETVYLLQEQYGGFFLRPDMGDKGFNLLMFWGAPTARENDVDRALNFILELSSRTHITIRAGISYHMAYAGFIGANRREDYTAYGWGVNLAARMMEHADEGQFWLDEQTALRAEKHFNLEYLGKFHFKGFKDDQKAFSLTGRKDAVHAAVYLGAMVGRKREMESLADFAEPIRRGEFAGVMTVKGEAGMGKSRLVYAFQHSDFFKETPANWVACQVDEILRLPFNPFMGWLKKRFDLVEGQPDDVNLAAFSRNMQDLIDATPDPELASELTRTQSALAALINLTEANSLYESLDAKGRYDNTLIALSVLLRAESLQKPLVLFIDDAHWLDEDTGEFMNYFVRTLLAEPEKKYPIAIITTQRPEGDSIHMMDEVAMYGIKLGRLASGSLSNLAEDILGHPITASLLNLLDSRAEGNPFFAEQILRYLMDQHALTIDSEGRCSASRDVENSLPTDVRAVLTARLDRLDQNVRETVQTASVLGREFAVSVLGEMLGGELVHHIAQAEHAHIWSPLSDLEYIFKHALLRDAAYSMQLQTRQCILHERAFHAVEKVYATDLEPHYGELAYHAEKGDLKEKAVHYLTLAGKIALGAYQNQQAIEYFTRALALVSLNYLSTRYDLTVERIELFSRMGKRQSQLEDLNSIKQLALELNDTDRFAKAMMLYASYYFATGDYIASINCAKQSEPCSELVRNSELALHTQIVWSLALLRLGQLAESMQRIQSTLEHAQTTGNRSREGKTLVQMGWIALEQKEPSTAQKYLVEAIKIAREVKDLELESKALNNLAISEGSVNGNYALAREYYEESYKIARDIGDRNTECAALINMGFTAGMQGDLNAARIFHEQALLVSREIGNRYNETYTLINLSALAGIQNEAAKALKYAHQATELAQTLSDLSGEAWAILYAGHAYLLQKNSEAAIIAYEKSIQIRNNLGQFSLSMEPLAGLVEAYLLDNNIEEASNKMEKILGHLENGLSLEGTDEPLRVYYTCYVLLDKKRDPRSQQILHTAIKMLETQASKFSDDIARKRYIETISWRRAVWDATRQIKN